MSIKVYIKDHIIRYYDYSIMLFLFLLTFYRYFSLYGLLLIGLVWILEGQWKRKLNYFIQNKRRRKLLFFTVIYFLYLTGLLYSEKLHGMEGGYFSLQVKLSLVLFPVIIGSFPEKVLIWKAKYTYAFAAGALLSFLYCLARALLAYFENGNLKAFYYMELSTFLHPSYASMYLNILIGLLAWHLYGNWRRLRSILKILLLFLVLFFIFMIILLSSKAGLAGLIIVVVVFLADLAFFRRKWAHSAAIALFFTAYIFLLISNFNYLSARVNLAKKAVAEKNDQQDTEEGTADRMLIWTLSTDIIRDYPFGVGTGDVTETLIMKYEEQGLHHALKYRLNAHNQFIQTGLAIGIPGLLMLIMYFAIPGITAIWRWHPLYLAFLALLFFNFMVEAMLETQAGVVFYAFFNCFFFLSNKT